MMTTHGTLQVSTQETMAGTQPDSQLTPRPLPGDCSDPPPLPANFVLSDLQNSRVSDVFVWSAIIK